MKKIRLTESELTNIIKRVINEQSTLTKTDVKIPQVIKEKGSELARMAKAIIDLHMNYCRQMQSQNPEIAKMDCKFVMARALKLFMNATCTNHKSSFRNIIHSSSQPTDICSYCLIWISNRWLH